MNHLAHLFMCHDIEVIDNYLKSKGAVSNEVNFQDHKIITDLAANGVFTVKADANFMRSVSEITVYASGDEIKVCEHLNVDDIKQNSDKESLSQNLGLLKEMNSTLQDFVRELVTIPEFTKGLVNRNLKVEQKTASTEKAEEFLSQNSFLSPGTVRNYLSDMRKKSKETSTTFSRSFKVANLNFDVTEVIVYYIDGQIYMADGIGKLSPFHQQSSLAKVTAYLGRAFAEKNSITSKQTNQKLMKSYSLAA